MAGKNPALKRESPTRANAGTPKTLTIVTTELSRHSPMQLDRRELPENTAGKQP
jgi:hypothetical protein